LSIFGIILRKAEQIYTGSGNQVAEALENTYNFSQMLEEIIQNTHHEFIRQAASCLHETISKNVWNGLTAL
jgi:hypothetical protein